MSVSTNVVTQFTVEVEQVDGYEFRVRFDKPQYEELMIDEPAPLGRDSAPNPARLLTAAVANCLSASFLFCTKKGHVEVGPIHTRARAHIVRTDKGRLRIGRIEVEIDPGVVHQQGNGASRCIDIFQDYCTVTESVRNGIDVNVSVAGFDEKMPAA